MIFSCGRKMQYTLGRRSVTLVKSLRDRVFNVRSAYVSSTIPTFSTVLLLYRTMHCSSLTPTQAMLGRRMRGGRGRSRHREPSPGDWLCQCGETNYRSKRECFKCGAPAPPLPPGVRRPSLPGEDPNDWACACGQMNFRGSVVCHKCAQPKPVPPGKETLLWTCSSCKGINRDHRKTCFKCGNISPNIVLSKK